MAASVAVPLPWESWWGSCTTREEDWGGGCGSLRGGGGKGSSDLFWTLPLCSASKVSKRFPRPGTALLWLKECVLHVKDLVHGFLDGMSTTPQWISGLNSLSWRGLLYCSRLLLVLLSCFLSGSER